MPVTVSVMYKIPLQIWQLMANSQHQLIHTANWNHDVNFNDDYMTASEGYGPVVGGMSDEMLMCVVTRSLLVAGGDASEIQELSAARCTAHTADDRTDHFEFVENAARQASHCLSFHDTWYGHGYGCNHSCIFPGRLPGQWKICWNGPCLRRRERRKAQGLGIKDGQSKGDDDDNQGWDDDEDKYSTFIYNKGLKAFLSKPLFNIVHVETLDDDVVIDRIHFDIVFGCVRK